MPQPEYRDIPDNDWSSLRRFVRRSNERLALLEGSAGPNTIHTNLDMDYNRILSGPANQTTAESDEFLTRDYLYSEEAKITINSIKNATNEAVSSGSGTLHVVSNIQLVASDPVAMTGVGGLMYYKLAPLDTDGSLMFLSFDIYGYIDDYAAGSTYMDIILPDDYLVYFPFENPFVYQTACIANQDNASFPSYWGIMTYIDSTDYLRIGRIQSWLEGPDPNTHSQMIYPVDFEESNLILDRKIHLSGQVVIPVI